MSVLLAIFDVGALSHLLVGSRAGKSWYWGSYLMSDNLTWNASSVFTYRAFSAAGCVLELSACFVQMLVLG